MTNTNFSSNYSDSHELSVSGQIGWSKAFDNKYGISFLGEFAYSNLLKDRVHNLSDIHYWLQDASDYRNNLRDNRQNNYYYGITMINTLAFANGTGFQLDLIYRQEGKGRNHEYYQNDISDNEYIGNSTMQNPSGSLPTFLDYGNSFNFYDVNRIYGTGLTFFYSKKNLFATVSLPYRYYRERISYHHLDADTVARRSYSTFQPSVQIDYSFGKNKLQIKTEFSTACPEFYMLMPLRNDMSPLLVQTNNPNMKPTYTDNFSVRLDTKPAKGPKWWALYELTLSPLI